MIGVAAVPEEALVVEAGGMGAPTVGAEKLDAYECEAALLGHSAGRMLPFGSSAVAVIGSIALWRCCLHDALEELTVWQDQDEGGAILMLSAVEGTAHVRESCSPNLAYHVLCRLKCGRAVRGHELRDWGRERPGTFGHWRAHGAAGRRCRLHGAGIP